MKLQPLQVKVPYWAKDIEHEGFKVLLAFMHRINIQYGEHEYTMQNSDINNILGMKGMNHDMILYRLCPEAKHYFYLNWTSNGWSIIKLKGMKHHGNKAGHKKTELVTIKDERLVRVWCFLLGAFRNHLLTDSPFIKDSKSMFSSDHTLFKYSQYEK